MTPEKESPRRDGTGEGQRDGYEARQNISGGDPDAKDKTPRTNLDWALAYARAGLKIIPCFFNPKTGNKEPFHRDDWTKRASDNPEVITKWFSSPRGHSKFGDLIVLDEHVLIGLLTGVVNGIDVIDIDKKHEVDGHLTVPGWERMAQVIAATPHDGHHLYYRHDPKLRLVNKSSEIRWTPPGYQNSRKFKLPGVDVRTTGGYVIAPDSVRPDGKRYEWHKGVSLLDAEGKLRPLVEAPVAQLVLKVWEDVSEARTKRKRSELTTLESPTRYQDAARTWVEAQAREVAGAPRGTRDNVLTSKLFASGPCVHKGLIDADLFKAIFWQAVRDCGLSEELSERAFDKKVEDGLNSCRNNDVPRNLRERDWLAELNAEYFIDKSQVNPVVMFIDRQPDGQFRPVPKKVRAFQLDHMNVRVRIGEDVVSLDKAWLLHPDRRQYLRTIFDPDRPPGDLGDEFNVWSGLAVAERPGSWRRLLGHVYRVLSNRDPVVFRYLVRWSAWCIQNPGQPAEVALILQGGQGVGKGIFLRALTRIFGIHGQQVSKGEEITGKFNGHLRGCCFLFADEAVSPRDTAAASVLKNMLTEPKLSYRDLYVKSVEDRNCVKVAMASNAAHVTHVEVDDRRNAVFECVLDLTSILGGRFAERDDYFRWIIQELKADAHEAMLYDLRALELGDWHPRKNVPETEAREEQKDLTRNPLHEQLAEYLDGLEGTLPWLTVVELLGIPVAHLKQQHMNWIGGALRELGWKRKRGKDRDGRNVNVRVKGDPTRILTAEDIRNAWAVRRNQQQSANDREVDRKVDEANSEKNVRRYEDLFKRQQRDQ
jgi:hypothetical protein